MLRSRYTNYAFSEIIEKRKPKSPMGQVLSGYVLLILIGTLLLSLPFSLKNGPITAIDALFTATSAVCVTGLSVLDLGTIFSGTGLWIIVGLMEIGGLGVMTFSTAILLIAGMQPGFSQQQVFQDNFSQDGRVSPSKILWAVIPFTFVLQGIGIAVYFWQFDFLGISDRILYSVFHAVSAFCNVGFSPWADSFCRFQFNPVINIMTCILVIAGGFGFLSVSEIWNAFSFKNKSAVRKFSLHTKIAFVCTFGLIVFGAVGTLLLEWNNASMGSAVWQKIMSSFFISISSRTAGFNSLNLSSLSASTIFLVLVLMFIGTNPGSCGGGLKTTTTAVIALLGFNRLLGRQKTQVMGRTIPEETVDKAVHLFIISVFIIVLSTALLLVTEFHGKPYGAVGSVPFLRVLFEVVSAYATCGLSMGITPELSSAGRVILCAVMFVGRVGPLFLVSAIAKKQDSGTRYAEENIMVG